MGKRSNFKYAFHYSKDMNAIQTGSQRMTLMNYTLQYHPTKESRTLQFNLFSGANNNQVLSVWNPSGMTGAMDYSFSQMYFGRSESEGLLSRQIAYGYGQLYAPTSAGFNLRLLSLNAQFRLPLDNIPISGFIAGAYGFNRVNPLSLSTTDGQIYTTFVSSAGAIIHAFPGILDIYVPLYTNMPNAANSNHQRLNIWKSVMFSFNMQGLNPFNIVSKSIAR